MQASRSRWAWTSVAVAALLVAGSAVASGAGTGDGGAVFVPTVPERVLDTRLASSPIRTLGPGEMATLSLQGTVPVEAVAVDINVTTTAGTQPSNLAVWPSGEPQPIVSAINWNGPTSQANGIAVKLGTGQAIDILNAFGNVDVVIDMRGYYVHASTGAGATGP